MNVNKGIRFQRAFYSFVLATMTRLLAAILRFRFKPFRAQSKTYLILANHNSDLDPVMLMLGTGRHARFVASANILKGFLGKIINLFAGPIPRQKGASADDTVDLILKNLRAGINVAMFPEGNKSWDGETCYISKRTAELVKESGVGVVTYRFDGDYLKNPRWAKEKRHGTVFGTAVHEYTADDLKKMSVDDIYTALCADLYVNAYEVQRIKKTKYKAKNKAEGIELTAYLCPVCHRFDTVKSGGNTLSCTCGMKATLDEYGFFVSDSLPFDNLLDWSKWEKKYLSEEIVRLSAQTDAPITSDGEVMFKENGKKISDNATVSIYGDRIEIQAEKKYVFPLNTVRKMGAFRTTRVFFSGETYVELFKEGGISGIKYFTLWRLLTGKTLL